MGKQMEADEAHGFDFVGYHAYAKRRYFEMVDRKLLLLLLLYYVSCIIILVNCAV